MPPQTELLRVSSQNGAGKTVIKRRFVEKPVVPSPGKDGKIASVEQFVPHSCSGGGTKHFRRVEKWGCRQVVPGVGEDETHLGHALVEPEPSTPMGEDDPHFGMIRAEGRRLAGAYIPFAGIVVSNGFRGVQQEKQPGLVAETRQAPGLPQVRDVPFLPLGKEFAHTDAPRITAAKDLALHSGIEGRHYGERTDPAGKTLRRVEHVVVALPTEFHAPEGESEGPGLVHALFIHARHQFLRRSSFVDLASGEQGEIGFVLGDVAPLRGDTGWSEVNMGIDDHGEIAPSTRVERTEAMFAMIRRVTSGRFMV